MLELVPENEVLHLGEAREDRLQDADVDLRSPAGLDLDAQCLHVALTDQLRGPRRLAFADLVSCIRLFGGLFLPLDGFAGKEVT